MKSEIKQGTADQQADQQAKQRIISEHNHRVNELEPNVSERIYTGSTIPMEERWKLITGRTNPDGRKT